jgi:hypothetical protein
MQEQTNESIEQPSIPPYNREMSAEEFEETLEDEEDDDQDYEDQNRKQAVVGTTHGIKKVNF